MTDRESLREQSLGDALRLTFGGGYTCALCGRQMKEDERHYVIGDARRIMCGCVTRAKTSGPIHRELFPECPVAHHDVWDHRWMTCDTRDAAIGHAMNGTVDLASIEMATGELTAREVMQIGLCTPQCMLALGDDGYDQCRCRCQGRVARRARRRRSPPVVHGHPQGLTRLHACERGRTSPALPPELVTFLRRRSCPGHRWTGHIDIRLPNPVQLWCRRCGTRKERSTR